MSAIFKREFKSYFHNVIGWLYIAATLALFGLYFFAYNLSYGYAKISYSLNAMSFLFLITVPVLTMRSLSEEQKSKTDQLIFTSPISVGKVVLAKYLAMAAVHTITVVFMALTPLLLSRFGTVPMMESYVAVLGFWLYGLACIAIGLFASSLTESQVIAAVFSFLFIFLGFMMKNITGLLSQAGTIVTKILGSYDLITPLNSFFNGTLSVSGLIYFVTITLLFLFLATQVIQKRRWSVSSKKIKLGVFSAGFVVVAVGLTVIVNLFVNELPSTVTSIDMTSQKLYSLTSDTTKYLKTLKKDVTIYVIAGKGSVDSTVEESLKRYEDGSSHIKVVYKDPSKYPNFFQQYSDSETISTGSVIVVCDKVSRVIDSSELFESTTDPQTYQSTVTGYDGEGQITSALQYVTNEKLPVIYELEGHGETALAGNFSKAAEKANVTLKSINLLKYDTIPDDAQAVIINGPASDFSADDAKKVVTYMQGGGSVFVTVNYQATGDMTNFNTILSEYGISVVKGLVAEGDSNAYYQNPFYLLPTVASTDYTSSVGSNYVFAPYTEGLTYPDSTDSTTYTQILTTSDSAVSKTDYNNAKSYSYEDGDTKGPFTVALAADRKIDDDTTGKLIVYGSQVIFSDDADNMVSGTNAKMFSNIISSLVKTSSADTIVIPAKNYEVSQLTIPSLVSMIIGGSIVLLLPLILIIASIVIWVRRRKR